MCVCVCVVVVVVEFTKMYPSTTGRFAATIGYVAPTPNHVHIHHVQQSETECPYSSVCMCAMSKMFEGETPQEHKPRIPQIPKREHPRRDPQRWAPTLPKKQHTPTPLPTTGPSVCVCVYFLKIEAKIPHHIQIHEPCATFRRCRCPCAFWC